MLQHSTFIYIRHDLVYIHIFNKSINYFFSHFLFFFAYRQSGGRLQTARPLFWGKKKQINRDEVLALSSKVPLFTPSRGASLELSGMNPYADISGYVFSKYRVTGDCKSGV